MMNRSLTTISLAVELLMGPASAAEIPSSHARTDEGNDASSQCWLHALASASRVLQKAASLVDHTCPLLAQASKRAGSMPLDVGGRSTRAAPKAARGEGWHVALPLRAGLVGGLEQPGAGPRHGALRR